MLRVLRRLCGGHHARGGLAEKAKERDMNRIIWTAALLAVATLSASPVLAQGHRSNTCRDDGNRGSYRQGDRQDRYRGYSSRDRGHRGGRSSEVARSLEAGLDRFIRSFDHALDHSRLNGSDREDRLNARVKRIEHHSDLLEDRLREGRRSRELVDRIFEEARTIDRFMSRTRLDRRAEADWRRVTRDLDLLARQYRVARWQGRDRDDRGGDRDDRGRDRHDRRG